MSSLVDQAETVTITVYTDFSGDPIANGRNRANTWFVNRLFDMLENADSDCISSIICWQPHGRCFVMRDQAKLNDILPKYFKVTKTSSFLRQLNIYGFTRIARGPDRGGYYHEMFLQKKRWLAQKITPMKVKVAGVRTKGHLEPNFWEMEWVNSSVATTEHPSTTMTRSMSVVSHDTKEEEYRESDNREQFKASRQGAADIVKNNRFSEVASSLSSQEIDNDMEELLEIVGSKPFLHEFVSNGTVSSLLDHQEDTHYMDSDILASNQAKTRADNEYHNDTVTPDFNTNDLERIMYAFQDESIGLEFDAFLQSFDEIC